MSVAHAAGQSAEALAGQAATDAARRTSVISEFLSHYYATNPVTATFTGVHDYDGRLPDWSLHGTRAEIQTLERLRRQLALSDEAAPAATLRDDATALDAELVRGYVDLRLGDLVGEHSRSSNPALWTGEAIFGVVSLMIRNFAPAEERLPSIRARLAAIPAFLESLRTESSLPFPTLWRDRAIRECGTAQRLLADGLPVWHSALAGDASVQAASSAFAETEQWLGERNTDVPTTPAGNLDLLLLRGHQSLETSRELLRRAEAAMEEAKASLDESVARFPGGTWSAVQAAIAADHPTAQEYYASFERRWREIHAAVSAANVVTWPDWPIRYVPIPEWARDHASSLYWLFYRSPAPFDPYTMYEYVVTPVDASMSPDVQRARLSAWNHSQITLNHVVHHGGLGHHVQNWHAIHRSSSRIGQVAAVDTASRIGMFCGGSMAEGWACYATGLAGELGLLTPLERLSEQHTAVRLLARCIVDIRMHDGDWPFEQCVRFYETQVGMTHDVATAEATKNSMFPGTALMYWLGTDAIQTARTTLERREGAGFSLKQFHDSLLSRGAIPAPLAARILTA